MIEYTDAVYDEQSGRWVSRAEVAEIPFTAFAAQKKINYVLGRLVVSRIPDLNPGGEEGQQTLFDTWRFHGFFTNTDSEGDTTARDTAAGWVVALEPSPSPARAALLPIDKIVVRTLTALSDV